MELIDTNAETDVTASEGNSNGSNPDNSQVIHKTDTPRLKAKHSSQGNHEEKEINHWKTVIPWFLTITCSLILICLGWFLIQNIEWFKSSVLKSTDLNNNYLTYICHMHLSMIKRSVGLFSGFAMMFVGTGVSFHTLKSNTDIDFKGQDFSIKLITASPGIIAMIIGALLIVYTIASIDNFAPYQTNPSTIAQP